ncbi:MAG: DNA-binding transcriptional regulator Fis [Gammaproteobacteria bacterium]|nr:DNA-binding transcriptional regulator Fis [Gammaproteobacteria bacterium]MBU1653429.1 DNA-binding transcriptional regulator Fis [Gammaproteobacteria bacterium]MBU1959734.1 DNA-binding transcriptional regulator Fis [Gammaproteobacteria bacterium]
MNVRNDISSIRVPEQSPDRTLRECVKLTLDHYFSQLDGHDTSGLYDLVINEVEKPLLETVLSQASGNQSRASAMLGISRSTLRKKLARHGMT